MPSSGRAACSSGQATRKPKASSTQHALSSPRAEKAMHPLRRDSSAAGVAGHAALRPPVLASRTLSAPTIPKQPLQRPRSTYDDAASIISMGDEDIAGDEFFQRYHFPPTHHDSQQDRSPDSGRDSSSDTEGPLSPTHVRNRRLEPRIDGTPSPGSSTASIGSGNSESASTLQDINIAVLGADGAGKSTFVRRALGLPDVGAAGISTGKVTLDGGCYIVRFVEMLFSDVRIGNQNNIRWPESSDGLGTPRIDAAVTIYDVTNASSLDGVPEVLHILSKSNVPTILVACKCDAPPTQRQVDPTTVELKVRAMPVDIAVFKASRSVPESHQTCLSVVARAAIAAKRPRSQASMSRRRANSSAVRPSIAKDPWGRKHERASSEISARFRPVSSGTLGQRFSSSEANKTFFNFEEESTAHDSNDSDSTTTSDADQSAASEMPSDENGYTFEQLVDRLLAQPMSKLDTRFVASFLALYRKFATPGQLFEAIRFRFELLRRRRIPPMLRIVDQLRYLAVIHQWASHYPGDFAFAATRRALRKFVASLFAVREFAVAAKEIMHAFDAVTEDDDTDWACSDRQRAQPETAPAFQGALDDGSDDDDFVRALGQMSMSSDRLAVNRTSIATSNSRNTYATTASGSSTQTLLHQVEKAERLARSLVPNPIKPLSKVQWHQMLVESEEAVARELTRIEWVMFSSIRPRDFVRYVTANTEEKKRYKSLENVTRMTEHFNHIAYLVANYVLLRDKPKHRAMMLEKWIKIARELRKLNNYNTTGAVVAGIKGHAVHRLGATRELLPSDTGENFLKLEMLMGTQKHSFRYRLAWENSSGGRIPYIPLHKNDLVSASEGNATFISDRQKTAEMLTPHPGVNVFQGNAGNRNSREAPPGGVVGKERINWRKFEIMGQIIVAIQRAQGTPYQSWPKNEEIRNLILDVKICKDDDDLYERSVQLEAPGAGEKKRFMSFFREPKLSLPHLPPAQNYQAEAMATNYMRI